MRANVLAVFVAALLVSGSAAAQTTALTHATVIDGTGAAPQTDVTIVMENGRIREMAAGLAAPPNATVIDLTGPEPEVLREGAVPAPEALAKIARATTG